ncbi:MAG: choice-of-anchor Q domain-containing protein, partial [Acidobacteriota bacterium]
FPPHMRAKTPGPVAIDGMTAVKRPSSLPLRIRPAALVAWAMATQFAVPPLLAGIATLTVDRFDDPTPIESACTGAPNDCSLRGAVQAANTTAGNDSIFVPSGTYLLTRAGNGEEFNSTGDLDIYASGDGLIVEGDSVDPPTIEQTTDDGIFHIHSLVADVTLRDLVLTGGDSPGHGGAINSFRNESLTLERMVFRNNHAAQFGGCVSRADSNAGNFTVTDSQFAGCTAGIDSGALRLDASPSPFQDSISDCQFLGNSAPIGGAAYLIGWNFIRINDSVFVGNQALSSTIAAGGSLAIAGVAATVERVSFVDSAVGPPESLNAYGGALYMTPFSDDPPLVDLINVTIARSTAESTTLARGAAIYLADSDLDLWHVTVSDSRTNGQHAIFAQGSSGPGSSVDFDSTIIDGGCASQGTVTLTSGAYNVEKPWDGTTTSTCNLSGASGDVITNGSLGLGPPAIYGGPAGVWTQALLPGSPAAGLVASTDCAPDDARTAVRAFLFCAAGAFESSAVVVPGPWIFADGFSSGDALAWSDTQ